MGKSLLVAVSLLFAAAPALGAGTEGEPKPGGEKPSDLDSEVSIRRLYDDFESAWNRHDPRSMAQYWAMDGDHQEPDGSSAEGRDAVEQMFRKEQATAFKDSKLSLVIETVWLITPNVALVDGSYQVDRVRGPNGEEIALRRGHLTSVLLREDGKWWVAASRASIHVPLPWRPGAPAKSGGR